MSDVDMVYSRLEGLQYDLLRNIWPYIGSTTEVLLSCSAVSPRLRLALHASLETFAVDFFGRSMGKWERAKGSGGMADYRSGLSGSESSERSVRRQQAKAVAAAVARCNTLRTLSLANMRWQDEDISLFLAGGKEIEGVSDSDKRSGSLGSDGRSDMLACLDSLTLANASLYRPPPLRAVVLTELSFARCKQLVSLDVIDGCKQLVSLDVSGTAIGDDALERALCGANQLHDTLRNLVLTGCLNCTLATRTLATATWASLEKLDITRTKVTMQALQLGVLEHAAGLRLLNACEQAGGAGRGCKGPIPGKIKSESVSWGPNVSLRAESLEKLTLRRNVRMRVLDVAGCDRLTDLDVSNTAITLEGLLTLLLGTPRLGSLFGSGGNSAAVSEVGDDSYSTGAATPPPLQRLVARQCFELATGLRDPETGHALGEAAARAVLAPLRKAMMTDTHTALHTLTALDLTESVVHAQLLSSLLDATSMGCGMKRLELTNSLTFSLLEGDVDFTEGGNALECVDLSWQDGAHVQGDEILGVEQENEHLIECADVYARFVARAADASRDTLRALGLRFAPMVAVHALLSLGGGAGTQNMLQRLEQLDLSGSSIDGRTAATVINLCPALRTLTLRRCVKMRALVCASETLEQLELAQCIGLQSLALQLPSLKMLGISATPCTLRIFEYDEAGDSRKAPLFLPALRHVDATLRRARGEGPDVAAVLRDACRGRGLVVKTSMDISAAQRKAQRQSQADSQMSKPAHHQSHNTAAVQRRTMAEVQAPPTDVAEQVEELKRKLAQTDLSSAERYALRRALNLKQSRAALAGDAVSAAGTAGSAEASGAAGGVTRRRAPIKREVPPWRKSKSKSTPSTEQ